MADILVVEDDKSWREIFEATFERAGFTWEYVNNADSAIRKLKKCKYKLVCVNLELQDYYLGAEVLDRLNADFSTTPVLLITGYFAGALDEIKGKVAAMQKNYPNVKQVILKGNASTKGVIVPDLLKATRLHISRAETVSLTGSKDTCVSWLHLSDLHLGIRPYEQDKVLKQLVDDVQSNQWKPNFIIVSGDITQSARPEEYRQACNFFDMLLKLVRLPKEKLFIVPGNHDLNWDKLNPESNSKFLKALDNPGQVIDLFNTPEKRDMRKYIFEKFGNYAKFVNTYFVDKQGKPFRRFSPSNYFYSATFKTKAGRVAIVGLNSSWASALNFNFKKKIADDKGHLLLGEPQVDRVLKEIEESNARIVIGVTHHPFDWLKNSDQEQVENPLRDKCHLILHGHLHEIDVAHHISPSSNVIILGAGTTFEKRDNRNGYSHITVDLKSRKGIASLRRYSPKRGGGWVADTESYPQAKSAEVPFSLANK